MVTVASESLASAAWRNRFRVVASSVNRGRVGRVEGVVVHEDLPVPADEDDLLVGEIDRLGGLHGAGELEGEVGLLLLEGRRDHEVDEEQEDAVDHRGDRDLRLVGGRSAAAGHGCDERGSMEGRAWQKGGGMRAAVGRRGMLAQSAS